MAWGRLALIHAAGEAEAVLPQMAQYLGYRPPGKLQEQERDTAENGITNQAAYENRETAVSSDSGAKMPTARFLRVRRMVRKSVREEGRADYLNDSEWCFSAQEQQQGGTYQFGKPGLLLPASRLNPFLLNALGQQQAGARLDQCRLVSRVAKGQALQSLPALPRQCWPQRLLIIVDASTRLEPYWVDFERIVGQLQRQLGAEVVTALRFDEGSRGNNLKAVPWPQMYEDWHVWRPPADNVPVLMLGDWGMGDPAGNSRAFWWRVARRLRAQRAPILTLNPLAYSGVGHALERQLQPNPLHDQQRLPRYPLRKGFDVRDESVNWEQILACLSVLPIVDTGLLRRLRRCLEWGGSELEGAIWNHPDVRKSALGIRVQGHLRRYQQCYQDQVAGTEQASLLWQVVEEHHREAYQGLKRLEQASRCVVEQQDSSEVRVYLQKLLASAAQGRDVRQKAALLQQAKTVLAVLPEQVWGSELSDLAYDVYALAHEAAIRAGEWPEVLPAGFEPERAVQRVLDQREHLEVENWQLVQVGIDGEFVVRRKPYEEELKTAIISEIDSLENSPPILSTKKYGDQRKLVIDGKVYAPPSENILIETALLYLELDVFEKPIWANQLWRSREKLFVGTQAKEGKAYQWQWYPAGLVNKRGFWYLPEFDKEDSISLVTRKQKVFISYARDEAAGEQLAEAAQKHLQQQGFTVFRDVLGLKPGDVWYHKLAFELESSDVVVLVLSEKVRKSKWVHNEISIAMEIKLPVIPVLAEPMRLPLWISHIVVLDFSAGWKWEILLEALEEVLATKNADDLVSRLKKPSWGSAVGEDQYGLYSDVQVHEMIQRFRWIEPGSFMMGSPEDEEGRWADEYLHHVMLSEGFWIADTTVTQALWQEVMGENPSHFKGENCPVEQVSWDDCQQFIKKLNEQLPGLQARLPSEAQWEYACRAGTSTPFHFGGKDDLNLERVNYTGIWSESGWDDKALQETQDVKSYPPNPWGLYEMHGNVREWCQDEWQANLGRKNAADPLTRVTGSQEKDQAAERVVRGGAWINVGRRCRSAYRGRYGSDGRSSFLGFRLSLGHELRGAEEV